MSTIMTFDTWVKKYQVRLDSKGEAARFETFGAEFAEVQKLIDTDPRRVWTMVDDGESCAITSGAHFVNRQYYLISELPLEAELDVLDVYDSLDDFRNRLPDGDYVLDGDADWFEVGGFVVRILKNHEGVLVDVYDNEKLTRGDTDAVVASTYAFDTDLENFAE